MNDISQHPRHTAVKNDRSSKKPTVSSQLRRAVRASGSWMQRNTGWLKIVGIIVLVIVLATALYRIGYSQGQKAQKKADEKLIAEAKRSGGIADQLRGRNILAVSGTVESVGSTEITVKQTNGEVKKIKVDKSTSVLNSKNAKIEISAVKKGDRVSVTGTIENDTSLAKRIRVLPAPKPTN